VLQSPLIFVIFVFSYVLIDWIVLNWSDAIPNIFD